MMNKMDAPTQPKPKINMNRGAQVLHVTMPFALERGTCEGSNGDDTSVIRRDPPHAWLVFGRFAIRRFP